MAKARISIASSGAGLGLAQAVYALLRQDYDPIVWDDSLVSSWRALIRWRRSRESRADASLRCSWQLPTTFSSWEVQVLGPRSGTTSSSNMGSSLEPSGAHDAFSYLARGPPVQPDPHRPEWPDHVRVRSVRLTATTSECQAAVHDACGRIEHQIRQVSTTERRALRRVREAVRKDDRRKKLAALSSAIVTLRGMVSALQKATLENIAEADGFEEAKAKTVRTIRALSSNNQAEATELGVRPEFDNLIAKVVGLVETAPYPVRFSGLPGRLVQKVAGELIGAIGNSKTGDIGKTALEVIDREMKDTVESTWREYGDWWDRATQELRDAADAATEAIDRRKEDLYREASFMELRRFVPSLRITDLDHE